MLRVTRRRITRRQILGGALSFGVGMGMSTSVRAASPKPTVTVGVLKFGTVNWEMATALEHGFDAAAGIDLKLIQLASNPATQIALQSEAVDIIVSDWFWVAGQRRAGTDLTLVPFSTAVGALMVRSDSPIASLADLKGKKIGVAGSPIDKSWLLLRAQARDTADFDPAQDAEPVFAAPALLNEKLMSGELDAALNFWHYAARLEAKGCRRLVEIAPIIERLAGTKDMPAIGYVFRESWAKANPAAIDGFIAATGAAKRLLRDDDGVWDGLKPLMRAEDGATFVALRDRYREGIPRHWGTAERAGAERLAGMIDAKDGPLPPGTFWDGVSY